MHSLDYNQSYNIQSIVKYIDPFLCSPAISNIARKTLNLLTVNCCSLRTSTKSSQLAALINEHDIELWVVNPILILHISLQKYFQ